MLKITVSPKCEGNCYIYDVGNSRVIWKYRPCNMYIHPYAIGVTEMGTITFILRQIGVDFTGRFPGGYGCVEKYFSVKV